MLHRRSTTLKKSGSISSSLGGDLTPLREKADEELNLSQVSEGHSSDNDILNN